MALEQLEQLRRVYSEDEVDAALFSLGYASPSSLADSEPRRSRQLQELTLRLKLMKPSECRRWLELRRASSVAQLPSDLTPNQAAIDAAIRDRLDATVQRLVEEKQRSDASEQLTQAQSDRYAQYKGEQEKLRAVKSAQMRQKEQRISAQRDAASSRLIAHKSAKWKETEVKLEKAHKKRDILVHTVVNEDILKTRHQELDRKYQEALEQRKNRAQEIADRTGRKKQLLAQKEQEIREFWATRKTQRDSETVQKLEVVKNVLDTQRANKETNYIKHFNKLLNTRDNHEKILSARSDSVRSAREGAFAKNKSVNDSLLRSRSESARSYRAQYEKSSQYAEEVKRRGLKNGVDMQTHLTTKNKMLALAGDNASRIHRGDDRKEQFLLRRIEEIRLQTDAKLRDRKLLRNYKNDHLRAANIKEADIRQTFDKIKAETDAKKIAKALAAVGIDPAKLGNLPAQDAGESPKNGKSDNSN